MAVKLKRGRPDRKGKTKAAASTTKGAGGASPPYTQLTPEQVHAWGSNEFLVFAQPELFPGMTREEGVLALNQHLLDVYERRLDDLGVLADLTPKDRRQLADVVMTLVDSAALRPPDWKARERGARFAAKRHPGQNRKLRRKLDKAREALEDLETYTKAIGEQRTSLTRWVLPYVKKAVTALSSPGWDEIRRTRPDLTPHWIHAPKEIYLPDLDEESSRSATGERPDDHKGVATEQLTTFFTSQCGLGKFQGDRRTGLIGNHFWNWNVAIDDEFTIHNSGTAPGSSAIRKRRTRSAHRTTAPASRSAQGRSSKKR